MLRRFLPVASDARLAPPDLLRPIQLYDPEGILGRINRTFRRRLRDRVEDLFQDACISGDLSTAEELLFWNTCMRVAVTARTAAPPRFRSTRPAKNLPGAGV